MGGGVDVSRATPANARDRAFVAGKNEVNAFGDGVPNADGGVFRSRGKARAAGGLKVVGFPSEAADPFRMTSEGGAEGLAGLGVPEADSVVHASCCYHAAVRGVAHYEDPACVPF